MGPAYETLVRENPMRHRKNNVHLYMSLANTRASGGDNHRRAQRG
jgi:hypothetical protein